MIETLQASHRREPLRDLHPIPILGGYGCNLPIQLCHNKDFHTSMDYFDSHGNFYSLFSLPRYVDICALSEMIQEWQGAVFVTVVARSDSKLLEGLSTRDGMSRGVRRRRHQRAAEAGNIFYRVLHETLYQLIHIGSLGASGACVATVEVADAAQINFLDSPMNLFHLHALLEVSTHTASRVRDYANYLQEMLGHIGSVYAERAGAHDTSAKNILHYISKSDRLADSLLRGAFPKAQSRLLYRGPGEPWCNQATQIRAASWNFSYALVKSWYMPFLVGNAVA